MGTGSLGQAAPTSLISHAPLFVVEASRSFHQLSLNSALSAHLPTSPRSPPPQQLSAHPDHRQWSPTRASRRASLASPSPSARPPPRPHRCKGPAHRAALEKLPQPLLSLYRCQSRGPLVFKAEQVPDVPSRLVFLWEGWRRVWARLRTAAPGHLSLVEPHAKSEGGAGNEHFLILCYSRGTAPMFTLLPITHGGNYHLHLTEEVKQVPRCLETYP